MGEPINLGPNYTYLSLIPDSSGAVVPVLTPYGSRGLTQTYEVITGVGGGGSALGSWLRRDIRGNLFDNSNVLLRKYNTLISCRDTMTPCLDGSWIGMEVGVECAFEFSYPPGGTPQRTPVSGSERTEAGLNFYRPFLTALISEIKTNFQEYSAAYAWQLGLSEV